MGLGGLLNAAFAAGAIGEGAGKGKEVMRKASNTVNKYDVALGNQKFTRAAATSNVPENTIIPPIGINTSTASDNIDLLYMEKMAYYPDDLDKDMNKGDVFFYKDYASEDDSSKEKSVIPKVVGAALLGSALLSAVVNKDVGAPVRNVWEAAKRYGTQIPKTVLARKRTGKIFAKSLKRMTKNVEGEKKTKDNLNKVNNTFLGLATAGAGFGTGNLLVHLLGDKYFAKSKDDKKIVQKSYDAIQEPVSEIYHQRQKADRYKDNRRKYSNNYHDKYTFGSHKEASELIDGLYKEAGELASPGSVESSFDSPQEKRINVIKDMGKGMSDLKEKKRLKSASDEIESMHIEKIADAKSYMKKMIKEDVLQNAITSIPFFAAPIGIGYAINKDLKTDLRPVRGEKKKEQNQKIIIDVPNDKIATWLPRNFKTETVGKGRKAVSKVIHDFSSNTSHEIPKPPPSDKGISWREFFKKKLPSSTVRSLTFLVPAASIAALTGRNIRGSGEKYDKVEKGKSRITIESNPYSKGTQDYNYAF